MSPEQIALCRKYKSACIEPDGDEIVGAALDTLDQEPLHGVRIMPTEGTTGWYIWGGTYSDAADFYQPICLSHLLQRCPHILKYVCLEPEFKFMIDRAGFEDVWRETSKEA